MSSLPPGGSGQRTTAATREEAGGVEQIEPGIWRITIPLPFALRWVNAYLLEGDSDYCLIDAGLATPAAEAVMLEGLAAAGIAPAALSTIVLTHAHLEYLRLKGRLEEDEEQQVVYYRVIRQK